MWKYAFVSMVGLAGCVSSAPTGPSVAYDDRAAEFGAADYESYEAARIARERGLPPPAPVQDGGPPNRVISSDELSAAGLPVGQSGAALPPADPVTREPLDAGNPSGVPNGAVAPAPGPIGGTSSVLPAEPGRGSGISDEQSFEAVSARESIESDAQRLARQAQAYRVIAPEPVPVRTEARPNIVSFALSTDNVVGQPVFTRRGIAMETRARRACARFTSPDLAQEAFLARGGPARDALGVDPDGDGFACAWDPAPFRAARS